MRQNRRGEPFPAIDRQGRPYLLTPLYRPAADDAAAAPTRRRPSKSAAADFAGIVAEDGREVSRAGRGRYFVSPDGGGELIALFSSHRDAV